MRTLNPKQQKALQLSVAGVAGWRLEQSMNQHTMERYKTLFVPGQEYPAGIAPDDWDLSDCHMVPKYTRDLAEAHALAKSLLYSQRRKLLRSLNEVMSWHLEHGLRVADEEMVFATAEQLCIAVAMTCRPGEWMKIEAMGGTEQ